MTTPYSVMMLCERSPSKPMDPESVDLLQLARTVRAALGPAVEGAVVGRTLVRDQIVQNLVCSQLEGEELVDTMMSRGFLTQRTDSDGRVWIVIGEK